MPYRDQEAQRRYQREWCARRRAAFFAEHVCERCGATDGLELHHRDPSQKISHAIWSWTGARREAELAKCIILCGDCHGGHHREAVRTFARFRARDASGRFVPVRSGAAR